MGLDDLPIELLSDIILQLPPSEFESLKIINKKMFQIYRFNAKKYWDIPIN